MDERRCVEVLREMLQYTMGTGVLVDEEREALDHAIATIERGMGGMRINCNNGAHCPHGDFDGWCHGYCKKPLPDPQPDGQEGI